MVIGVGLLVMVSLVAGALAAARLRLPPRLAALITAFGGGILLAAVACELLPADASGCSSDRGSGAAQVSRPA